MNMQDDIIELRKEFLLDVEQFEDYYKTALDAVLANKKQSNDKRLIIVGGQSRSRKIKAHSSCKSGT